MWCYSVILVSFMYVQNPVLFFDDFQDPRLQKWNTSDDGVKVLGGNVNMGRNVEVATMITAVQHSEDWTDYSLEFKIRMIHWDELSTIHIGVRNHIGAFNIFTYQKFVIYPNKQQILAWTRRPKKMEDDPPIRRGEVKQNFFKRTWYVLNIETLNNKFVLSLDDQELMSYTDLKTPPGNISLLTFGLATEIEIDYIRVAVPSQSVSIQEKLTTTWGRIKNP